ncbi:proline racemase family protein [Pseudogemmobacter humi]|uniref:Proline racemase n=1 Tax=Pseudogemmobacter humi TaxID=2483812 RepID=A0A3P5WN09_9RHOB|nr:proline racemase family protein [Pseudogemmobacter humi]VDC22342.1 Proline racemase [Pseudogemmobacter humi]
MRWNRVLQIVDCHAEGEIGKVIVGGFGQVRGETMFDKRNELQNNMDHIRKMVLFEPRGAVWHNSNMILPSNNPEADMGFVILEICEYPAMSGSNTICVATVLLETGILPMKEPVTDLVLEAPAGLIRVRCDCKDGKVTRVTFVNQPAFVYHMDSMIEVDGLGSFRVDVAYGGMTYVFVEAADAGFAITPDEARDMCAVGQRIKAAAAEQLAVSHPENPEIPGITQLSFTGPLRREGGEIRSRNAVVVSPGRCDRSPCGTGSSARLAVMHARGQIRQGEVFVHQSIIGTEFHCGIEGLARVGPYDAVIPSVAGQAWITGLSQMGMDPTDPFQDGFTLTDTWMSRF